MEIIMFILGLILFGSAFFMFGLIVGANRIAKEYKEAIANYQNVIAFYVQEEKENKRIIDEYNKLWNSQVKDK